MNTVIDRILGEVTAATLEKLAFLFASPLDELPAAAAADLYAARVEFTGPLQGAMELRMSRPAVDELAANMLGVDEGSALSPEERRDAFKELLNVICGNVLPVIAGEAAEFNLKTPCLIAEAAAPETPGPGQAGALSRLMLENGICIVALRVDGSLPQTIDRDPL
jgi:hypothetical protein